MTEAKSKRVGLLGGSFDPPHEGHLWMAKRAADQLALEEVWLLLACQPPHKSPDKLHPYEHRLAMTRILAREDDRLRVCEIEKELPAPAYTVDTLTALLRDHPCHRFVFLMGEDSSQALRTWKEPERIFQMVEVAVLAREGFEADPAWPCCVIRGESHPAQSRLIRRDLSRGLLPQDLTNSLLEYVRQEGLYSGGEES